VDGDFGVFAGVVDGDGAFEDFFSAFRGTAVAGVAFDQLAVRAVVKDGGAGDAAIGEEDRRAGDFVPGAGVEFGGVDRAGGLRGPADWKVKYWETRSNRGEGGFARENLVFWE
jgi:hypothetical protein